MQECNRADVRIALPCVLCQPCACRPCAQDTARFCVDTLCEPELVAFLNSHFVCWGGDVRSSDAFRARLTPPCGLPAQKFQGRYSQRACCAQGRGGTAARLLDRSGMHAPNRDGRGGIITRPTASHCMQCQRQASCLHWRLPWRLRDAARPGERAVSGQPARDGLPIRGAAGVLGRAHAPGRVLAGRRRAGAARGRAQARRGRARRVAGRGASGAPRAGAPRLVRVRVKTLWLAKTA